MNNDSYFQEVEKFKSRLFTDKFLNRNAYSIDLYLEHANNILGLFGTLSTSNSKITVQSNPAPLRI
jgi:hypothetical protein